MTTYDSIALTARVATCTCGKSLPSPDAITQPFFAYRGPGTSDELCAECPYHQVAHEFDPRRVSPEPVAATRDHAFSPRSDGFPTDSFYCGDYTKHPAGLD